MAFDFFKKNKELKDLEILPVIPQEIYEAGVMKLRDVIAPAAVEVGSNFIKIGGKYARTLFIISYPRFLSYNWFAPIINLDKIFDISIFVNPLDTGLVLKQLQKKLAEVQSQINSRTDKGLVRDPVLDTAHEDIENLRNSLQQAQEKIFTVGLYLTIYGETETEVNNTETEIRTLLDSKLILIKPAIFQQAEGFQTTMPTATDNLQMYSRLNSSPLSSVFPFVSSDLTSDKGILFGQNRHNASLVLFDRFSLENYNSVTFAKSGSGKSYTTKLEIIRTLMFDVDVIVIDPEREYERLANALDGRYFNVSLSSKSHINPFDLPVPSEGESSADVLRSNIINLVGLFRLMLGGLTPTEDSIIDRAITETYASRDITPDSDFSNATPPTLSDFELILSGMDGAESVLKRLEKYTKGTWSGFLNHPTNVDLNRKFIVFSIRDMEEELRPIAMYVIMHYVWNAIRKKVKKRLLVVDEAWIMMKNPDTASFLFGMAKRCRKYFLGLSTITQDVGDFLLSPYGAPIIINSSIQILLKQSPSSIELVQKTFNLTEEEKFLLLECNVGEGIFFVGNKHVAIKIIPSYTEDQIITSDPSQLMAIDKEKGAINQT